MEEDLTAGERPRVGDGDHRERGRIPGRRASTQHRIDRHRGGRPPSTAPLLWRFLAWVGTPGRRLAERREAAGRPPREVTLGGLLAGAAVAWLVVVVPIAFVVYRRGGLPPNKGSDVAYFSWEPSPQEGLVDAVMILVVAAIVLPAVIVACFRQDQRDVRRAIAELAAEDVAIDGHDGGRPVPDDPTSGRGHGPTVVGGESSRVRRHPFPPLSAPDGPP